MSTTTDILSFRGGKVNRSLYLAAYLSMSFIWFFCLLIVAFTIFSFQRFGDLYGFALYIVIGFSAKSFVFAYFGAVLSAARLRDAGLTRWWFAAVPLTIPTVWWLVAWPPVIWDVSYTTLSAPLGLNLIVWLIVGLWPPRKPQEG